MLGSYIFTIFKALYWDDSFIIMQFLSLFLVTVFVLKVILSDISNATPAFFLFPFAWKSFPFLYFQSMCIFRFEVSVL